MEKLNRFRFKVFEDIKHINEYGAEVWYARELAKVLDYVRFDKFLNVIEKAKVACKTSKNSVLDHISHVGRMVKLGSGAEREISDVLLSRYACYLIVQNADSRKETVALGQAYFAIQTRRQELQDDFHQITEAQKRIAIREELREHNKDLADAAKEAGVKEPLDYATFQNFGYMGLYGGLKAKDIQRRKKLKKSDKILDHMGSSELAANLFRATQTEDKLRREQIRGKGKANRTHFEVGKKVRTTIEELGGTMPENLPTPKKSMKEIEKEKLKIEKEKRKEKIFTTEGTENTEEEEIEN